MSHMSLVRFVAIVVCGLLLLLVTFACSRSGEQAATWVPDMPPVVSQEEPMEEQSFSGEVVDGVRVVQVAARQFEFEPETIVVVQGESVRLEVTSEDVAHGFDLHDYGIDRQLPPNDTQIIEFTAGEPGEHEFYCSVYCGADHGKMRGMLIVVSDTPAD